MAHVWWHTCITAGEPTGEKVPLKLVEGKRGNIAALLRFPHDWTDSQVAAAKIELDGLAMQMLDVVRQPQESIKFNPMQGTPTPIDDA